MGANKYVSDLWRKKHLGAMKIFSKVGFGECSQSRSLASLSRPFQIPGTPTLGHKGIQQDACGKLGFPVLFSKRCIQEFSVRFQSPYQLTENYGLCIINSYCTRSISSKASDQSGHDTSKTKKDVKTVEDPFDSITYNIPEKPVTFAEGASYSLVILAGLGIAAAAGYAVFKELIFEPKEYKIYGKALKRIQDDSQIRAKIGYPITGYGQESRNRAARQRIPNRIYTDEDSVEHVEINFYIRGPHGNGKVYCEMFKDQVDKDWKFTYLIVEIKSPSPAQLILESYIPAYDVSK